MTQQTELEKLKLPVPNPYGTTVKIDRVNMLIERAYKAGLATATKQAVELERDKLFIKVNTLRLKNLKAFYASRAGTNELYMQGATILLNLIEMWFPERYKEALSQKGEE